MSKPPIISRYLRTPEAAAHVGLAPKTLEKHRCYGTGPVFLKVGGRILYTIEDLDAWAHRGARRSTSDPGTDIIYPAKKRFAYLAKQARRAGH